MVGCVIIGMVAYLATERAIIPAHIKLLLTVGFLGGFTTFSSFGFETFDLIRNGTAADTPTLRGLSPYLTEFPK